MRETRRHEDRPADVAARADRDVGTEAAHDGRRLCKAVHGASEPHDVRGRETALKPLDIDGFKGDAFLRYDVGLQAFLRANVEKFRRALLLGKSAHERQGRIYVAARAAARNDDLHAHSPSSCLNLMPARPRAA